MLWTQERADQSGCTTQAVLHPPLGSIWTRPRKPASAMPRLQLALAYAVAVAATFLPARVLAQETTTTPGETSTGGSESATLTENGCASIEEEQATPDFGSQVSTLTIFLYITIFLTLGIQWVRSWLHKKTINFPHIQEVLEGVYEELSSVGVTSFLLFLLQTSTLPQLLATAFEAGLAREYTAVFHEVHMALFFVVFLFLLTVIVVQLYTKTISKWWYMYEQRTLQENITDFNAVHTLRLASRYPAWLFDILNHNRVVEVNDALTFTLIKARFFTAYAGKGGIPREFSFARYLHLSLNEISVECVRLHWSIWLFTLVAIGINWIRYKVIPVSSEAGSVILMITGIFSVCVFLFLFWKGRSIRRKLLDERHFLESRFMKKLHKIAEIRPISLYEDYQHHTADFTRVLTFTKLQMKHQEEDEWRQREREQWEREREQVILAIADEAHAEHQAHAAAKSGHQELAPLKRPSSIPSKHHNPTAPMSVDGQLIVPQPSTLVGSSPRGFPSPNGGRRMSKQIFTDHRLSIAARQENSIAANGAAGGPPLLGRNGSVVNGTNSTNAVADEVSKTGGPSFLSATSAVNRMAASNPLSPVRGTGSVRPSLLHSPSSTVRPSGFSRSPSLAHLVSHKMKMLHPQQKKPAAASIYDKNGEAATGHGLDPTLHPTASGRKSRKPSIELSRKKTGGGSRVSRQPSTSILAQGSLQPSATAEGKAATKEVTTEWERSHAEQLKVQSKGAELRMEATAELQAGAKHHQQGPALVDQRNAHIYDHTMKPSGEVPHVTPHATTDRHLIPHVHTSPHGHIDIAAHPRHIPEGDELHELDGGIDEEGDSEGEAGGDEGSDSDVDFTEEHLRELQMKQIAMQDYIKEMHDEAIRHAKLHCCVTCVPPPGSKSQLEEAFMLSDPNIHLRLFQIIMLFQSTYVLASCYYFYTLSGKSQVVYLVFTFLPLLLVMFIFIPKFLRNHTITTSVHSQIRLEVVSDMMEAEQLQKEDHHMNSLHVRLQARAISLSEIPIASFAGEYRGREEPFSPHGVDQRRLPQDWQAHAAKRKKEKEQAELAEQAEKLRLLEEEKEKATVAEKADASEKTTTTKEVEKTTPTKGKEGESATATGTTIPASAAARTSDESKPVTMHIAVEAASEPVAPSKPVAPASVAAPVFVKPAHLRTDSADRQSVSISPSSSPATGNTGNSGIRSKKWHVSVLPSPQTRGGSVAGTGMTPLMPNGESDAVASSSDATPGALVVEIPGQSVEPRVISPHARAPSIQQTP